MVIRFISYVLPNPTPGSRMILSSAIPARLAILTHSWVSASMSTIKLLYSVLSLLCIKQQGALYLAMTGAISGSYFSPQISLIRSAPCFRDSSATHPLYVSTEIGISKRLFTASITGSTRSISSCAPTGVCPGRVDSPPISRISAPSAIIASVCFRA